MIELKHIFKSYQQGRPALQDINISFPETGFFVITGENGAGKSTLLNVLGLFDCEYSGSLLLDGVELNHLSDSRLATIRREKIAYLRQTENTLDFLSMGENACLDEVINDPRKKTTNEINELSNRRPNEVSEGEKMLVLLSSLRETRKRIILLDEITSHLDKKNTAKVMDYVTELSTSALVIFVSHDPRVICKSKNIINMKKGRIDCAPMIITAPIQEKMVSVKKATFRGCPKVVLRATAKEWTTLFLGTFIMAIALSLTAFLSANTTRNMMRAYETRLTEGAFYEVNSFSEFVEMKTNEEILPIKSATGLSKKTTDAFLNAFPEDTYFISIDSNIAFTESLPNDGLLRITQDMFDDFALENYIIDNHIKMLVDDSWALFDYVIVDAVPQLNMPLFPLASLPNIQYIDHLLVRASLWENSSLDFSDSRDVVKDFGSLGENYFICPALLTERSGTDFSSLLDSNDKIFVSEDLEIFLPQETTRFLSLSNFDLKNSYTLYQDLSGIFPNGVNVGFDSALSEVLEKKEILVTDDVFHQIIQSKTPFLRVSIQANDRRKLAEMATTYPVSIANASDHNVDWEAMKGLYLDYYYRRGIQNVLMGVLIILYLMVTAIFSAHIRRKNEANIRILVTRGLSWNNSCFLFLIIPLFLMCLGQLFGSLVTQFVFYRFYNPTFSLYGLPLLGITLGQSLIFACLHALAITISILIFFKKKRIQEP